MDDQQWQQYVAQAIQDDQARHEKIVEKGDAKLNVLLALFSPMCFFLAFWLPRDWGAWLVFSVWFGDGLCSLIILMLYAYTRKVPYKIKEAALSFLLGNMFVFLAFCVKPN